MKNDKTDIPELDPQEIKQVIFRLAHFDPSCKDDYGNQVIDYLVLDALASYGQLIINTKKIKEYIKNVFHLDFEESEINASGIKLAKREIIKYEAKKKFEPSDFQILPATEQKIKDNLANIQQIEDEVIEDWKMQLISKYKDYPVFKDKVGRVIKNLQLFTSKMFIRHGVECVALLYPEAQKTQHWLEEIETSILDDLPKIDAFTDAIVKLEIPSFFKNHDSKRKKYITSLFNSSFFWHLVQVDEKCSKLLREVTKGQRLYLDNNILYSLVGLHGADCLQSVHSMLKLANALGYELLVTTKSKDEFHESLKWQMKELKRKPPLPRELAKIATENLDADSFLTLYWSDFAKNGTSIEEFVAEKSHLENILKGLNIKTTDEFRKDIEGSDELLEEESTLRSVCVGEINDHIIEHDAFHRIFINRIRGDAKYHFSEAVGWFLTQDSKLPEYARVAGKGNNYLPFCITSDQWVQINRPLLARTANREEYDESFHVLVTQPFLRTMISTVSLEKAYNEVLGRLARYKNMNPRLALNLVTDKHFMLTIASETDEMKIEVGIENKFVDIAKQLESEKGILEKEVEKTKTRLQTEIENREKAEGESKYNKEKLKSFKKNLFRWGSFAISLVLASLLIWLHSLWLNWPWLDIHKNKIIIKIAFQLLLIFGFLNIPLKQHWKIWLGFIIAIILAILTIAC